MSEAQQDAPTRKPRRGWLPREEYYAWKAARDKSTTRRPGIATRPLRFKGCGEIGQRGAAWLFCIRAGETYPGLWRGTLALLDIPVPYGAAVLPYWERVRKWRKRKHGWPLWALERVRAAMVERMEEGRLLLEELDAAIAAQEALPPRMQRGFARVRDDGMDRRNGWRK